MKTLYILLLSCITFISAAQDPDPALFENTWYLEKLDFLGETYFTPHTMEVTLVIFENGIEVSHTPCKCGDSGTSIEVINDVSIEISDIFVYLGCLDCPTATMSSILSKHNTIYGFELFVNYSITSNEDILSLEVTNNNGDKAYYNNVRVLDIPEVSPTQITLYPNPVQEQLFIQSNTPLQKASIYTVTGRLVKEVPLKADTSINVQDLVPGLYFITLENEEGELLTKKFVKQ